MAGLPLVRPQLNSISQTPLQVRMVIQLSLGQRLVSEDVVCEFQAWTMHSSHTSDPPRSFLLLYLVKTSMGMLELEAEESDF